MIEININNQRSLKVESKNQDVLVNGSITDYEIMKISDSSFKLIGKKSIYDVDIIYNNGKEMTLSINNSIVNINVADHIDQILEKLGMDNIQSNVIKEVKAPMPGSILDILIKVGDEVHANDQLLVLEAMKMENVIKSSGEGIVDKIHVSTKENVEKNQVLISFE